MRPILLRSPSALREALHATGREAARQAVCDAYREAGRTVPTGAFHIEKDPLGKPWGRIPGERMVALSISHAYPFALAAATLADDMLVGADVERIRDFESTIADAFLTPRENARIACSAEDDRAYLRTLVWSLKESVLKALGVGLRLHPGCIDLSSVLERTGDRAQVRIDELAVVAEVRSWRVDVDHCASLVAFPRSPGIMNLIRPYGTP